MCENMGRKIFLAFAVMLTSAVFASGQNYGVKTNVLYDLTSTVNLGLEYRLADRWTFDISGNYNAWTLRENMKWKHWMVQPEFRFWNCMHSRVILWPFMALVASTMSEVSKII